jgi:hypothetical protein
MVVDERTRAPGTRSTRAAGRAPEDRALLTRRRPGSPERQDGLDAGALLRRYEPVLRMTAGELFCPISVADYLRPAALMSGARGRARVIAGPGTLDPVRLAELGRRHAGEPLWLRYVQHPMSHREYRAWKRSGGKPPFTGSSGAVLVGLLARIVAALVRLTLLLRGKVPPGHAAAAAEQSRAGAGTCHYYGRVSRDGGYIALQYWFLYPMNDWRSSFGGLNDHEADWEQITVFLAEHADGSTSPAWVAFSSHDEKGADLRRRWDDPDLARIDEHPVVYVGAGSHSGAYLAGEYLISVAVDLPGWLESLRRGITRIVPWRRHPYAAGFGIPYLDYRRGDGLAVGPGQQREWTSTVIDDDTGWVRDYGGLWGLDTSDPLGGERAPAGPRYERDGRVRRSWEQPVAWAALDGEPPTREAARALWAARAQRLRGQLESLRDELDAARAQLRSASLADRAADRPVTQPSAEKVRLERQVAALRDAQVSARRELEAVSRYPDGPVPEAGVHAHLRHRPTPLGADRRARSRLLRLWAPSSATILFAALGLLLLDRNSGLLLPVLGLVATMLVVEAVLRRHLVRLLLGAAVAAVGVVAVLDATRLLLGHARFFTGVLLLSAAAYVLTQSLVDVLARRDARGAAVDRRR